MVFKSKEELFRKERAKREKKKKKPKCCDDGKNYVFDGENYVKKKEERSQI